MKAQLQFSEGKMVLYCQACFKALHMSFHPGRRQESLACLLLANLKRWILSVGLTLATVLNGSDSPGHRFNLKVTVVLTLTEHLKIQTNLLLNHTSHYTWEGHFLLQLLKYFWEHYYDLQFMSDNTLNAFRNDIFIRMISQDILYFWFFSSC